MKSSRNNKNSVFRNIYEQPYNERTRLKLYNSAKGKPILWILSSLFNEWSGLFKDFAWLTE